VENGKEEKVGAKHAYQSASAMREGTIQTLDFTLIQVESREGVFKMHRRVRNRTYDICRN
jgi:hypothetical protein